MTPQEAIEAIKIKEIEISGNAFKQQQETINRQKEEIERLEGLVNNQRNLINELNEEIYRKGLL